jgi:DNA end-binding protein Ku
MRSLQRFHLNVGATTVGLKSYAATCDLRPTFRPVHATCGAPLRAGRCSACGVAVSPSEAASGYEVDRDEYVPFSDTELSSLLESDGLRILDFVPARDLNGVVVVGRYFLGAAGARDGHDFAALREALARTESAAVVSVSFRNAPAHLAVVRAADHLLVLDVIHFADEMRDPKEIPPDEAASQEAVAALAGTIASRRVPFDHGRYRDTYREGFMTLLSTKIQAASPAPSVGATVIDFSELLRRSLDCLPANGGMR